jgi:bifunctional UDP-N-acetylglucosamine pyrophosphorylase/glucosamine-1-phosphate N-acetyltransferase
MRLACVILAAGLGKRMHSPLPKVLHRICGWTMLRSVINSAEGTRPEKIVVVAGGSQLDLIRDAVGSAGVALAVQKEAKGTGHALQCALPLLKGFRGDLLIINGDTPLLRPVTLKKILALHKRDKNDISFLSFIAERPDAYGRVLRGPEGAVLAIVEEKDADRGLKSIKEVNSGVYVISSSALHLLDLITMNRLKKEYYLTDIVSIASKHVLKVSAYCIGEEDEFMGVNTRAELIRAAALMRRRIVEGLTENGVVFVDPDAVYIDCDVRIGADAVIYPNVYLEGGTRIGKRSVIYPNTRIKDSLLGSGVIIRDSTVIDSSIVRNNASVGPFAHIRPGSVIGPEAKIGNFVELKKTVVGRASKASHLSYLGDAVIGRDVNIGAGTITCNYDGKNKHRTVIEDGVFVGSDTQLVAPVKISKGAYIGAGSTITRDVPRDALAITRVPQKHYKDWAKKKNQT